MLRARFGLIMILIGLIGLIFAQLPSTSRDQSAARTMSWLLPPIGGVMSGMIALLCGGAIALIIDWIAVSAVWVLVFTAWEPARGVGLRRE